MNTSPRRRSGRPQRRRDAIVILAVPLVVLCCGCPFTATPANPGAPPFLDTGSNNSLSTATKLSLAQQNEAQFRGSIDSSADIDVYNLGTLAPGDRITIDVQRSTGNLDAVAALFDSHTLLVAFNDDRAQDGSDLNPYLDIVIRGATDTYYLGIIGFPGDNTTGEYTADLRVQRQVGVPSPQAQVVFLNWAGGNNVLVPNVGTFDLPPFSATDVGLASQQTAQLKDRVQQIVAERYTGYGLVLLNSDDQAEPTSGHSTVYFGGFNRSAFAISEEIDTFNADPSDKAIVFTESFPGAFTVRPTLEQMAQAMGNTTAHEVGHLLGLVHTADCDDLMDTTCFNDRILSPQQFDTGTLDDSVFPFGNQPERDILSWLIGFVGA